MSEEQNQASEQQHTCSCNNKVLTLLVILSLLLSVVSLTLSIVNLNNGNAQAGKKVVISKQYDKGRTLAKAQATNKPIIVFFYTDWCGFCQKFVPTFHKISKMPKIRNNFAIAYVNCEKEENQKLMEEYGVHGFPTVFVIDTEGNRTQLDNNTFFNNDSKDVVSKRALEIIGIED